MSTQAQRGVERRMNIERQLVDKILEVAVDHRCQMSVDCQGEELVAATDDVAEVRAMLLDLDIAYLYLHRDGDEKAFGWILLVFGNDGWDLVSDYTVNLEDMLSPVTMMATELEDQYY